MWNAYVESEKEKHRRWMWRRREDDDLRRTAELTKGIKNQFWLKKRVY